MAGAESGSATVLTELRLTRSLTAQLTVVGLLGFVVSLGLFGAVIAATGTEPTLVPRPVEAGWWNGAFDLLVFLALSLVVVPVHEFVHGLAIRRYGGRPRYGVGLAYIVFPYAFATTEHVFERDEFVVVALAPLVVVSVVGVPLMVAFGWSWLVVPLAANAGGAVGDLWMALTVLSYPEHVRVEDSKTGLTILGQPDDDPRPRSVTTFVWDATVGAAGTALVVLLAVGVLGPFVLSALGVTSLTVGDPGTVTFLFEYVETADGLSFSVGPGTLILGAALGLLAAFVRSRRRHRNGRTATGRGDGETGSS